MGTFGNFARTAWQFWFGRGGKEGKDEREPGMRWAILTAGFYLWSGLACLPKLRVKQVVRKGEKLVYELESYGERDDSWSPARITIIDTARDYQPLGTVLPYVYWPQTDSYLFGREHRGSGALGVLLFTLLLVPVCLPIRFGLWLLERVTGLTSHSRAILRRIKSGLEDWQGHSLRHAMERDCSEDQTDMPKVGTCHIGTLMEREILWRQAHTVLSALGTEKSSGLDRLSADERSQLEAPGLGRNDRAEREDRALVAWANSDTNPLVLLEQPPLSFVRVYYALAALNGSLRDYWHSEVVSMHGGEKALLVTMDHMVGRVLDGTKYASLAFNPIACRAIRLASACSEEASWDIWDKWVEAVAWGDIVPEGFTSKPYSDKEGGGTGVLLTYQSDRSLEV